MNITANIKEQFDRLQSKDAGSGLSDIRQKAFQLFNLLGIPTSRNEEWKYTRVSGLFENNFQHGMDHTGTVSAQDLNPVRLPGHEEASELFFINGIFSRELSVVRSSDLVILPLEEAAGNEYKNIFDLHFNHSGQYLKDGINAMNTALAEGGIFLYVPEKKLVQHPVYIYNITDTRSQPVLSQPRSLVYVSGQAELQIIETYHSLGSSDSMTNQVMEMVVEKDAILSYCKIQDDADHANQVSTTHIRQIGKSVVNTVTISLNGGTVRNNLHAIMEAPYAEAHLYGLYFPSNTSHIDNHTIVDNAVPHCLSNELYKGIMDGNATGVFNGKIFVRKDAQKTNAFQSNKNVLLSETASINSKPQLEIFADDVKCSHGCTVGSLDPEGLFYLQSRGIPQKTAMALLLQGFTMEILEKIKLAPIRHYVETLIMKRLTADQS